MRGGGALFGSQGWYSGSGAPTALNPLLPSDGNFYYDTDNEIVYYRESGSWEELGGFNTINPVLETEGKADSYRTPVLLIGDEAPSNGDDFGEDGDFYYSREDGRMYYRGENGGGIRWWVL